MPIRRTRVTFEDNIKFVPATSQNSEYQGPRFPNIQSMFKQNSAQHYYPEEVVQTATPGHEEHRTANTIPAVKEKTADTNPTATERKNKEDVNTEASEFIKRRYHNLELQKLLSMKA